MKWDHEVDMVCTEAGAAGLATAISAVDFGGDVFVAASTHSDPLGGAPGLFRTVVDRLHPWPGIHVSDADTRNYLAALSSDVGSLRSALEDADLPISIAHESPDQPARVIQPFLGAKLREWAARCLASPYGYLHTRVTDWRMTALRTTNGEVIEVAEIGSMTPDPIDVGGSVLEWLTVQAHDRGIEIHTDCSLHRIVFEEGDVAGAVFTTPDGPLAIRARHGVTVATGGPHVGATPLQQPFTGDAPLRVCLVSRHASRFGRLELLDRQPAVPDAPSTCTQATRQLRANLHETQGESPAWRCAWAEGYPLLGT